MPSPYYVNSNATGTGDGSSWVNAFTTLAAAAAVDVAGDTIYVSKLHAESLAATCALAWAGTADNPTKIICCDDAAIPPTAVATTGSVTTTGGFTINATGSAFLYGLTLAMGSGANNPSMMVNGTAGHRQHYRICTLSIAATSASARIVIGQGGSTTTGVADTVLENVFMSFGNTAQRVQSYNGALRWTGGGVVSGSALTIFLEAPGTSGRGSISELEGLDLTGLATNCALALVAGPVTVSFRDCKLPPSWTGTLHSGAVPVGARVVMYNCDSGATNYRFWLEDYYGNAKQETTLVKTGGASDGTTTYSMKMATTAGANFPLGVLRSIEIPGDNETVGTPVTITVDILHDSLTALKNDEIWLEVQYLGSSAAPVSTLVSCAKADILATSAAQPASVAVWTTTGMTNPNKQKLAVTFTPQMKGYMHARVVLAKPSYTVYVDPLLQVS